MAGVCVQPDQLVAMTDDERTDFILEVLDQHSDECHFWTLYAFHRQIVYNQTGLISLAQLITLVELAQPGQPGQQDHAKPFLDKLAKDMFDNSHVVWPDLCDMGACQAASRLLFGTMCKYYQTHSMPA
jgi:hypothetical protein